MFDNVEKIISFTSSTIDINFKDENNLTVLHYACIHRVFNPIKKMLNSHLHVNINVPDAIGRTPLHLVSKYVLVFTILHLASKYIPIYIWEVHLNNIFNYSSKFFFRKNSRSVYEGELLWIKKKYFTEYATQNSFFFFFFVVKAESVKIISFLIDNGADVNSKDVDGLTPLHYAVADGRNIIVEVLLQIDEVDVMVSQLRLWFFKKVLRRIVETDFQKISFSRFYRFTKKYKSHEDQLLKYLFIKNVNTKCNLSTGIKILCNFILNVIALC